jgi:hypothetical protein
MVQSCVRVPGPSTRRTGCIPGESDVRLSSSSRRAVGVLAVTAIGMSTAVLGLTGVAQAVPTPNIVEQSAANTQVPVPADVCAIDWTLIGARGGSSHGHRGGYGHEVRGTTTVAPGSTLLIQPGQPGQANGTGGTSGGSVTGTFVTCTAPAAPTIGTVAGGDRSVTVTFRPSDNGDDDRAAEATGYQVSIDDGVHWTTVTTTAGAGADRQATLGNLANGHEYEIRVRALSASLPSNASEGRPVTPRGELAAPTHVTATVHTSSITISWEPPTGTDEVEGYYAFAVGAGTEPEPDADSLQCEETDAAGRSCLLGAVAGRTYEVVVGAVYADGHAQSEPVVTAVVPAPSVPSSPAAATATLTTDTGAITTFAPGQELTVIGTGFLPGSTVQVVVYSTPIVLGSVTTAADGTFSVPVTIPASLEAGQHSLVASGVDATGNVRVLRADVVLGADSAASAGNAGSGLAFTGFTPLPLVVGGLAVLTVGAGLLVATRRRSN